MPVDTTSGNARRSHRLAIDSLANAICAPHFPAKSSQRGFIDSMRAIFFDRRHPFSCFSAVDRPVNVIKAFPVNKAITLVLAGKPLNLATLVLKHAHIQIAGHPNVKCARLAGRDIRAIGLRAHNTHQCCAESKDPVPFDSGNAMSGSSPHVLDNTGRIP